MMNSVDAARTLDSRVLRWEYIVAVCFLHNFLTSVYVMEV